MYVLRNCKFGVNIEHGQPPASPLRLMSLYIFSDNCSPEKCLYVYKESS